MSGKFGGNWTIKKLNTLRDYLIAYKKIFDANPKARHLRTHYIDAFAGEGDLVFGYSTEETLFDIPTNHPGSVKIALSIPSPFHKYHFIEKDKNRYEKLLVISDEFPHLRDRISIQHGDCREELIKILESLDKRKDRAVVFLDPYGMQVEFDLLQKIAKTEVVDLWLLVPHAIGFMRQLTKSGEIISDLKAKLDRVFGESTWYEKFYSELKIENLFGEEETVINKKVNERDIAEYYNSRLNDIFVDVAPNPSVLKNNSNVPIFILCFASSNPKGAKTAIKIAKYLLEKKHGR